MFDGFVDGGVGEHFVVEVRLRGERVLDVVVEVVERDLDGLVLRGREIRDVDAVLVLREVHVSKRVIADS